MATNVNSMQDGGINKPVAELDYNAKIDAKVTAANAEYRRSLDVVKNLSNATDMINGYMLQGKVAALNICYVLRAVDEHKLATAEGYKNTADYSEQKFGLGRASTNNMIRIAKRYLISKDGAITFNDTVNGQTFSTAQLQETLSLTDADAADAIKAGEITDDMHTKDIREVVKKIKAAHPDRYSVKIRKDETGDTAETDADAETDGESSTEIVELTETEKFVTACQNFRASLTAIGSLVNLEAKDSNNVEVGNMLAHIAREFNHALVTLSTAASNHEYLLASEALNAMTQPHKDDYAKKVAELVKVVSA